MVLKMKTVSDEFIKKAREIMDRDKVIFVKDFCKELNIDGYTLRQLYQYGIHAYGKTKCGYCGRAFFLRASSRATKFCCPEHKKLYFQKHRAKTKVSICEHCGKEFRQYSFRNCRFCSPQCAGLHRRKQKDEL